MSFCRITGRSKGLPKPNYFPLLPPISPADAKRFCRITGKSYGLPSHHYIPVLLASSAYEKSKCKITNASGLGPHHYTAGVVVAEKRKHVVLKDYRYVFPILEGEGEQQKVLRDLLKTKNASSPEEETSKFVYTVQERRCSLVFPAQLEAAVRDGDVRDVMLSKDRDSVLLRLKQGKNVSVDFVDLKDYQHLYDGLGPQEEVLKEREAEVKRKKRKRKGVLDYAKRIFEEKERAEDEEFAREQKMSKPKLNSIREDVKHERIEEWTKVSFQNAKQNMQKIMQISGKSSLVHEDLEKTLDWTTKKQREFGFLGKPLISRIPDSVNVEVKAITPKMCVQNIVYPNEKTCALETIPVVSPFEPCTVLPDPNIREAIEALPERTLESTADVCTKISGEDISSLLPSLQDIAEISKCLVNGEPEEVRKVKGLKLDIGLAKKFVCGQHVQTPSGSIFVPGQTLPTPQGLAFVPGFTVHTPEGPMLLPGQIVEDKSGERVFVAGVHEEGGKFVQGQTVITEEGPKFIQGQTVLSEEGPKFVAGLVANDGSFVPGQTIDTPQGPKFLPGQSIVGEHGELLFVPGQSAKINDEWEFVPGQCLETPNCEVKFVPGRIMDTAQGQKFIPGQNCQDDSGEIIFLPGVTAENGEFLPGAIMDTPKGTKFVQGQVLKTPEGNRFVPGRFKVTENGFEFAAATNLDEVLLTEVQNLGIPLDDKVLGSVSSSLKREIFGHMVQTEMGIEFVPENSRKLPEGKRTVPGQLVRDKDTPRFVPGIKTDDGFLPGQVVMTEKGEQFVPGQVVDTSDGPKFVPGQMVDTKTGQKFVPGQIVETTDGPRFVPGQIVETKAGPTFIPGQIISTDDKGSRFVPGQVVDTSDGPRFVPGRVVESGEGVIFVPGQIVQTEEGPRFVAPDLIGTSDGEFEFSVQGFEVTPEELSLLRLHNVHYHPQHHDTSIDARMLRQLSEAGLSVGRKVKEELPEVNVDIDPRAMALEQALVLSEKLGLRGNSAVKMAQVVSTVAQLAKNIQEQYECIEDPYRLANGTSSEHEESSHISDSDWLQEATKAAMATAILALDDEDSNQDYVHSAITEAFNVLLRRHNSDLENSVEEILRLLLVPENRGKLCQAAMVDVLSSRSSKVDILRSTVRGRSLKDEVVLERLSMVLEEDHDSIGSAFRTVSRGDPELLSSVLKRVSEGVGDVETEQDATETVRKAIVQAVRESSEQTVRELLNDERSKVREMLLQAVGLARALGMTSVAGSLLAVISDSESTKALSGDKVTLDVLKRLTVMRKLAEESPRYSSALRQLCSDPEIARADPSLRALVRESAALMIVPEEVPLHSSADIPTTLLNSDNSLAIEDFLIRRGRRRSSTFMILKQGMQAVVPREAARSVLTGEVPYTVLDEDGIRHFEPLHVFSALKLKDQTAHRFSMYCCPVAKEDDLDNDALSSYTGITSIDSIDTMINEHGECNGVVFSPSDRSIGYSASRENTPSFRRLSSILQDSTSDGKSPENFVVVKEHNEDGFSVHVGDIVEAIEYSERAKKPRVDPEFQIGEIAPTLDNSAAKHRISIRPRRNHSVPRSRVVTRSSSDSNLQRIYARTTDGREGWLPTTILMQTALSEDSSTITSHRTEDSHYRREAVIKELVETEEEFGRDLQLVVERYLKPLDNLSVPRIVRDNKDIIFTNFKQIADFHNTVLIEGVNYYADQPRMLGKTFLRLERDFDKHVAYCRDEPLAQEFLQTNDEVREYFEELSQNLGDDKSVSEHLKLPIQRINDYQLLLKELVKYSTRLGENCDDLQKALDLMLGIPHKATDNKFLSNIEGFKGNIYKLGRLISHEWFTIVDREDKSKERYLFLFKARILVCKVRRISEDRSVFVLKDIIRLPEVEVKDDPKDDRCFELYNPSIPNYPITLIAHKDYVKDFWLKEIREYASDLVALAEHAADDLQLAEVKEESKPEEKGVPVKVVPSPLKRKIEEVGKVERTEEEVKKSKDSPAKVEEVKEKSSKVEKSQVERVKGESVKVQQVREEKLKDSGESVKAVTEVKEVTKKEGIKEAIKTEVGKEKVEPTKPEVAKETSKSNLDTGKQEKGLKEERSNPGEKVAENPGKPEGKLVNVEDSKAEMSRRYSSSRYSSSAKVVEEYSSVSSSTHGMSYTESSVSSSNARAAASYQSSNLATERIAESSSSYTSAIGTSSNSKIEDSKTAKISLGATNTGKPKFAKTIEGCNVEPSRETKALIHVIAGECATFECSLSSSDAANRILWLKDNKPLEDKLADRVTTTAFDDKRYKLEIQNVHEADSGIYTARATNSDGVTTCTAQLVVQELTAEERKARAEANAPIFLVRLKDTELLENTYLRFMIKVKGDPNPALKFFKDGVLIDSNNSRVKIIDEKSDKGFYELVIVDVQKEDAGKYSCTATNRFGDTSCEAQVTVTDEKAIFAGLPEGLLAPGEEPQFTWLRDGQPFDPEERFKVLFKDNEDTLALVFQHVKPEDAGLYTCVAQTSTGNISCSAELTVQGAVNQLAKDPEKPKLESESRTSEVNVGGSAMLDLQVKGYPKPDIKWTKDGEEIIAGGRIKYLWEDEESLSLVIKHVTAKDAGVYTIKAKNELGEDETQIELIVKSAPKVVQRQNDINALVDDVIEMILKIEATPAPEVKWYKDGQLMEESDRIQIVKEGNDTYKLIIKGGRLLDGGSYSIVAKNEINQTSEMWNLSVTSPPRIKKGLGEPKIVNVGENLTLKIEIDSQIESSVTWLKDEEVLVEDDRVKLSHDGDDYILKITGTVSTDAARYKVKATNQYGTVSDETRVKVHGIPRFKVKLQDTTVKEGDVDVEFNVQIESYPKPTVQWFFGDCEITEKREEFSIVEDGDNCKLILKEVKSELKGKYSCKVANEYGESSCEATLTVNTKPKMTKKLSDVKVKEGDTLKLHVEVTGTPDPEIKWFKDGEEVSADTRIKITRDKKRKESYDLTVTLIKGSDGGVYEVRAQNEMGEVSCKSKVTIMTKTEEKIEEVEQEESSQKVQEEDLEKYQQAGVEGLEKSEKSKVQVIHQDGGTVTISYASTTTHEAVMTGPDERHLISKLTTTKVEVQEMGSELPQVEEVASYSYSVMEENDVKSQNGVLVEEFSEGEENQTKLKVNRGVSIVSVSDDESTLKAMSRDDSTDDVQNFLHDDEKPNGHEEFSRIMENGRIPLSARITETIIEERSIEESLSEAQLPKSRTLQEPLHAKSEDSKLSKEESKLEVQEPLAAKQMETEETPLPKTANSLSRQGSKLERRQSSEAQKVEIEEVSSPKTATSLSRQSSKLERRRSSEAQKVEIEEVSSPKIATSLSRQSSKLERRQSTEAKKVEVEEISSPKNAISLSRENSIFERQRSIETQKAERSSVSRQSSQKGVLEDAEEVDEELEKLFDRVKRQRSVLDEILDKESSKESNKEVEKVSRKGSIEESGQATATPEIVTSNLEDRTIFETQTTCFEVKVTGLPRPDGKWFKDGKQVRSSDRLRIEHVSETFKLTLSRAQSDDEGIYSFVATNKLGEKTVEGFLTVASVAELRKPRFIEPLEDTDVADGATGEFKAVFTADPVPEISWSYNGSEISPEDERIKMTLKTKPATSDKLTECSVSLSVPEVKAGDTGEYSLFLINKHGEAEASARLDLLLRPEVQKFEDHSAPLEEITQWEVVVVGNPKPKIMWVKGEDTEIQQSDKHELSEDRRNNKYTLKINGVDFDDAGTYKVVAENFLGDASAQAELKILTMEPTFVAELSDVHSDDREDIELKLRADGIPKPKVKWLKDGVAINQDDRHFVATYDEGQVATSLFIKHFSLEDVGTITCEATNCVGKAETSCQLIMNKKKPTFNRLLPRSAELDEGEPLEFKIKIEGSPIPGISWLKDGEPVVPDDHIQIETLPDGSSKLSIDRIKPTDCGAYKVIAKNSSGEESSLCAVAVKPAPSKPSFTQPLENVKVMSGEPLRLEARVVAFPNPQIQWFKDGLPVRPTKEISFINDPNGLIGLTIDKVTPEDAGAYSLVAWNSLGEITGLSNVDVEEKERRPDFLSSLQPVTVVEGFPAKLEVKTLGKPVPTIKWTHNGEEIVPDGEHFKVISQPDGTVALLIDKATPEDAGEYSAIASNDLGEAACSTKLQVAGKSRSDVPEEKPSFLCPMRDVSVEEGQPLLLTATFVGNPIPDVTWTKDDKPVELSDIVALSCDGKRLSLEINPSHVNDAGVYKCKISSPLGDDESSAQATVRKVFQPPKFTQKFTDLQQLPNYDAKFPARINGVPRPDITWYFNDNPILKDDDKYKIKRDGDICCLYVKDCAPEDSGKYTCKAVNKDGEAECSARLDVVEKIDRSKKVEPPSFMKRIGDCEIYRGMAAKFTACVTGIPEPEFEWFKDNEKMWPSDRIQMDQEGSLLRLTIRNVDDLDAGTYRLRIFNPHGEDSCSADLIYESLEPRSKRPLSDQYTDYDKYRRSGIPLPLADRPIISRMMDRHLTLSWKPSIPIGPRVPVTYLVEMCELPDGDWFTARSGIRSCICDIRNLVPFRDYKFRVRVENKYGISDPSPFAQTYRSKLEPDPPKFFPYLAPGIDFRPETSPYFPKDFDIERPPHDGYAQAPRFLRQEYDTQYGVKNHNCSLFWFVYGYPKPRMTYYFNDELIECGGRYDQSYTRNGQATLFINKMLERDEGIYEAVATNEHGEARQRVKLACAEYPTFIQRPEETVVMLRRNGTLTARVTGVPYPDIKWFKDWKPITTSSRIKIQFVEPDTSILSLSEAIAKDEGLYSISAGNVAGSVSSSAMVHIEMNEQEWNYRTYRRKPDIKTKERPVIDLYDLGDELGRGTQGVTYHAVERSTGKNFAAKVMHGLREHRPFMHNEMDVMNNLNHKKLLRLHDAYENDNTMTLITELAAGGELADNLMKQTSYTEYEIAGYIRQILWGLEHMHDSHYAHLGLTLNDLLISHPGGDNLKIGDFGLARRISSAKLMTLNYGVPEYVAPEVSNNEGVSYPADMWSVGIITYILLSGISPFRGTNDKETLLRIRDGRWEFDERWTNISNEARDFVRSLLIYQPEKRLNVRAALEHPWLTYIDRPPPEPYRIPSEYLKNYHILYRDWYSNASCRTWYRRRKFSCAFEHPTKMIYPPGHRYTPEPEDRRYSPSKKPGMKSWEDHVLTREPIDTEIGMVKSEGHYQTGPDTYLLQLRDTDFPVRIREYMKVACNRSPGYSRSIAEDQNFDWRAPIIRERRRFTDVMDEEIDDERRERINRYGAADNFTTPRRLKHELGTRLESYVEADAMMESKKKGHPPFFREKPQIKPIEEGKRAYLTCLAVGDPKPSVQWYKNDIVIQESNRVKINEDPEGRSILSFNPAKEHDIGIYKVVARNPIGQSVVRTRVLLASVPSAPDSPEATEVSDTEVLLRWKQPKYDGNSAVLCYNLQYKEGDGIEWIDVASNIDHEFYVVKNLKEDTSYNFRLSARNRIGWSEHGIPTKLIKTKGEGSPKVQVTRAMKHLQQLTEGGQEIVLEEDKVHMDYSIEERPVEWCTESQLTNKYSFISELSRGQFSVVVKGIERSTNRVIVAKILDLGSSNEQEKQVNREYEALRSLRHERIALLEAAYKAPGSPIAVFVLEKLQGADVLSYFSSRHEFSENCVATVISQILDGLQYLHWRGLCHLDIQPDNVVMASVRSVQVKLVDFGSAKKISKLGSQVSKNGHPEYRAPEVYSDEMAYPQTDIWMVGVLTYVLLSGVSPFRGKDADETRQNITFVRYRFEHLFKELSQEATRFLMLVFKRAPSKRPVTEECHEHRWLMPTEYMIKKRERAVFLGNRLKEYSDEYHAEKLKLASQTESLATESILGSSRTLIRSTSIQDELLTTF
ncbi:obscurin isoform X2 [Prorops nasuta]|uniref:obscurin isoform X2 n=1 Tax=Prorops nasuta TaxID=863751 RepID=UPI0034CECC38